MEKINIHYFSGTGNVAHAVTVLEKNLKAQYKINIINIEKPLKVSDSDIDLFLFPVYSWALPHIMATYLKKLPAVQKRKAVVCAICGTYDPDSGGNSGYATQQAAAILRRRGYSILITDERRYPTNWIQFSSTPDSELSKKITVKSDAWIVKLSDRIKSKKTYRFKSNISGFILYLLVGILFSIFGRRIMGKYFTADSSCNGCRVCQKSCPARTIHFVKAAGRPYWGRGCESCNRCMNICPQKSIQTSYLRIIFHLAATVCVFKLALKSPIVFDSILKQYPYSEYLVPVIIVCAGVLLFEMQLRIVDPLVWCLESVPGIRRLFQFTFTRGFRRYTVSGFKPEMRK